MKKLLFLGILLLVFQSSVCALTVTFQNTTAFEGTASIQGASRYNCMYPSRSNSYLYNINAYSTQIYTLVDHNGIPITSIYDIVGVSFRNALGLIRSGGICTYPSGSTLLYSFSTGITTASVSWNVGGSGIIITL
jgi:hypothetical protein